MIKKIYILIFIALLSSTVFGQFIGKDDLSVSLFYMQKNEIDSAKKYIDLAIQNEELKEQPKTWYYKGFIYKELYKTYEKENKTSSYRLAAVDAFKKMWGMEGKEEFSESASKIVKYLASTLYNDAARMLTPEDYLTAVVNYNNYKEAILLSEPQVDLTSQDVKFKLALASMLNRPADTGEGLDSLESHQIKKLYIEILVLDKENPVANYNLAILYYNEAADIINNMDYDMDIDKLNEIQDHCVTIFLEALPYMKKSYELNYNRKETLIGLSNIYYGLNDMIKSEEYKKELADLEKDK